MRTRGIFIEHHPGAAATAAAAALDRDTRETRRIFSRPCRGSDRSMGMQECERAGFFVPYGRLALRFFRELHNQRISSLIIPQA